MHNRIKKKNQYLNIAHIAGKKERNGKMLLLTKRRLAGQKLVWTTIITLTLCLVYTESAVAAPDAKNARVLGFETPVGDWSKTNGGATLGQSNIVSEGTGALSVVPLGWTEINSIPLSSIGQARNIATINVRIPQTVYWGEVRIILVMPSQNVWWREIGSQPLSGFSANTYHTLSFPLDANTMSLLSGTYSDLAIKVVLNAPTLSAPYLIDNLVIAEPTSVPDDTAADSAQETDNGSTSVTFTIPFPEGQGPDDFALFAGENLSIGDRSMVLDDYGYAAVGTAGTTTVNLGSYSTSGTVYSNYKVWLRDGAKVAGDVVAPSGIEIQNLYTIEGQVKQESFMTKPFSWTVDIPAYADPGIHLNAGQSLQTPINPGRYGFLTMHPNSSVTLTSGTYIFDKFQIDADAAITLDDSDGPVFVYVVGSDNMWIRGNLIPVNGDYARTLFGYLGTNDMFIERQLIGTVFAPNAKVVIRQSGDKNHKGSIFAKHIEFDADAKLEKRPFGWLIGDISVEPQTVCLGEPVDVSVDIPPCMNETFGEITVSINGSLGSDRTLSFFGNPGPRKIIVAASTEDGYREQRVVDITVEECPGEVYPNLTYVPDPLRKNTAEFHVVNASDLGQGLTYLWDFGDGTDTSSAVPYVSHDYTNSIDKTIPVAEFKTIVVVEHDGVPFTTGEVDTRFISTYALDKKNGLIRPDMMVEGNRLNLIDNFFHSSEFSISNLENEPIHLENVQYELISCDLSGTSTFTEPTSYSANIPAKGTYLGTMDFSPNELPDDTCFVTARFTGHTDSNLKTAAHATMRVVGRAEQGRRTLSDSNAADFVRFALTNGLTSESDRISVEELMDLKMKGYAVPSTLFGNGISDPPEGTSFSMMSSDNLCDPGAETREGYECVPVLDSFGNPIYDVIPLRILNARKGDAILSRACGLIGEVLEPMGQLYSHIGMMSEHHDKIVHSTFDFDRALKYGAGYFDDQNSDGFLEYALKYAYPGSVNQTVMDAYLTTPNTDDDIVECEGYDCKVPSGEKPVWCYQDPAAYDINGFSYSAVTCGGTDIIEQKVMKPFPEDETANRPMLMAAADAALMLKAHYRFYTYTHGYIIDDPDKNAPEVPAPDEDGQITYGLMADWPNGASTVASSCAVFVRKALETAGFFEPCFPCNEEAWSAEIPTEDTNRDGYFKYAEDDRKDCAKAIYSNISNMVFDKIEGSWFKNFLTGDVADDVATQVTNCFVTDRCVPDTSKNSDTHDDWKDPGDGYTVSPHDAYQWWPGSNQGGPYGYTEPLDFNNTAVVTRYEWVELPKYGDLRVTVVSHNGSPLQNAEVTVNGQYTGNTDAAGQILFSDLPADTAEVLAIYTYGEGENVTATEWVVVAPDDNPEDNIPTDVSIEMPAPRNPDVHRISLAGLLDIGDDELGNDWDDFSRQTYPITAVQDIEPALVGYDEQGQMIVDQCYSGEVRARIWLYCTLLEDDTDAVGDFSDNLVRVRIKYRLYEGTSCSDALGDPASHTKWWGPYDYQVGAWGGAQLYAENTDENLSQDYMFFTFNLISQYKWNNPASKDVRFDYNFMFGRNNHDEDRFWDYDFEVFTLDANQRFGVIDWTEERGGRYLHTTGVALLYPDDIQAKMLFKVNLTGGGWAGPIGSIQHDFDWVAPGLSHSSQGEIDDSLGFANYNYTFSNL
jgi:hypothetical protein